MFQVPGSYTLYASSEAQLYAIVWMSRLQACDGFIRGLGRLPAETLCWFGGFPLDGSLGASPVVRNIDVPNSHWLINRGVCLPLKH